MSSFVAHGQLGQPGIRSFLGLFHQAWASEPVRLTTSVVGTAYLLYGLSRTALFIWDFWRPSKLHRYRHAENGSWALVTGATDGIGYGFADVLLERGFNVLLHGRNPEKLERKRAELSQKYPARSLDVVVADASKPDDSFLAVADKAKNLPGKLTVLVNNVGGIPMKPDTLLHWEIPHNEIDVILNVNIRFTTQLTSAILPLLKQNGPGLILNCGSLAGIFGIPYLATYSGTKAFIHAFTSSVRNDCIAEGVKDIEVMGLLIGSVQSAGNENEPDFVTITSRECAEGGLNRVGSGKTLAYVSWRHAVPLSILMQLPAFVARNSFIAQMKKRRATQLKAE